MTTPIFKEGQRVIHTNLRRSGIVYGWLWNDQHECFWYRVLYDEDYNQCRTGRFVAIPEEYLRPEVVN